MIFFYALASLEIILLCYKKNHLRVALVNSFVLIAFITVLMLEALSLFKEVNASAVSFFWLGLSAVLAIFVLRKKNYQNFFSQLKQWFSSPKKISLAIFLIVLIFGYSFALNFLFPSSNWDSMTYHLSRIMHWIQNGNLNFYVTGTDRQLFYPPGSEYLMLNVYLLMGNDYFLSLVQYNALILCILCTSLIVDMFLQPSQRGRAYLLVVILFVTMPMAMVQATNTQNDLLAASFALLLVYFGLKIIRAAKIDWLNFILFCVSLGLGCLVKPTALGFVALLCFIFAIILIVKFKLKSFALAAVFVFIFVLINGAFFARNYEAYGNVFGRTDSNFKKVMSFTSTLSTTLENITMHFVIPNRDWNDRLEGQIEKFETSLGWRQAEVPNRIFGDYRLEFSFSDGTLGNFWHFFLITLCLLLLFFLRSKIKFANELKIYGLCLLSGAIIFATIMVWQPWQPRLDLPLFILFMPLVVIVLCETGFDIKAVLPCIKKTAEMSFLNLVLLCTIIPVLVFESDKKIWMISWPREAKYMKPFLGLDVVNDNQYKKVTDYILSKGYKKVGLAFTYTDSWEYPIWVFTNALKNKIRIEYIGDNKYNPGFADGEADVMITDRGLQNSKYKLALEYKEIQIWEKI